MEKCFLTKSKCVNFFQVVDSEGSAGFSTLMSNARMGSYVSKETVIKTMSEPAEERRK